MKLTAAQMMMPKAIGHGLKADVTAKSSAEAFLGMLGAKGEGEPKPSVKDALLAQTDGKQAAHILSAFPAKAGDRELKASVADHSLAAVKNQHPPQPVEKPAVQISELLGVKGQGNEGRIDQGLQSQTAEAQSDIGHRKTQTAESPKIGSADVTDQPNEAKLGAEDQMHTDESLEDNAARVTEPSVEHVLVPEERQQAATHDVHNRERREDKPSLDALLPKSLSEQEPRVAEKTAVLDQAKSAPSDGGTQPTPINAAVTSVVVASPIQTAMPKGEIRSESSRPIAAPAERSSSTPQLAPDQITNSAPMATDRIAVRAGDLPPPAQSSAMMGTKSGPSTMQPQQTMPAAASAPATNTVPDIVIQPANSPMMQVIAEIEANAGTIRSAVNAPAVAKGNVVHKLSVDLYPAHLGKVTVNIARTVAGMTATIVAETPAAATALAQEADSVIQVLRAAGVTEVTVSTAGQAASNGAAGGPGNGQGGSAGQSAQQNNHGGPDARTDRPNEDDRVDDPGLRGSDPAGRSGLVI